MKRSWLLKGTPRDVILVIQGKQSGAISSASRLLVGCGTTCWIVRSWERTVNWDIRNTTTGWFCLEAPIHSPADTSTLWYTHTCPFEKLRDATAVFWYNAVYILGGSQLFPIKRMDCYNILKDS